MATIPLTRHDSPVAVLLESAARGAESAWREIVRRYSPLVLSVCRRYQIAGPDADDVRGNVWLRLVANLITIREPAALPGRLTTTAQRECLTLLRHQRRQVPSDQELANQNEPAVDTALLVKERYNAVCNAVTQLSERDQELLSMLFSDPPTPYAEISSMLSIPIGAIGPTRQRCLARVRRIPAITTLLADNRQATPYR
jgi:RNA polymerase sigma factor (sigma-70 family)